VQVDNETIYLGTFKERYQDFLTNQIQEDNLMNRYLLLNSMIDETLILKYAQKNNLNDDEDYLKKEKEIKNQLLLNLYFDKKVNSDFTPTEAETRNLYKWQNMTIHVRHLFSRDKNKIYELNRRMKSGEKWEKLAEECFQDSALNSNGGDLGWYKLGELDTQFEMKAFTLSPGEISSPVKTTDGYSIIHLVESQLNGFLIEDDYQSRKNKLVDLVKSYRQKRNLIELTNKTLLSMNVNFDETVLNNLYQLFISKQKSLEPIYSDRLVSFNRTEWTVFEAIENLASLSLRQLSKIDSAHRLREAFSGLIARQNFLDNALKANLHKTELFKKKFDTHLKQSLVSHVVKKLNLTSKSDSLMNGERREQYFSFRNQLASEANILIDSLVIKKFIM
jgi:parvulin-like peptidyl-prolyl isomerase